MRRLSGFSLIELMIALLIGSLLMSGVFNILVGAKQAYRVQDELSRTQENARFAADFIARDLRMAGFRGCRSGLPLNLMVSGADSDWRYNLLRPVQGYQGVANAPSELNAAISDSDGWKRGLFYDGTSPSGRVIEPALFLEDLVLFTAYSPDGLLCEPSGTSRLYGLDLSNGVRRLDAGLTVPGENDDEDLVGSVTIGSGLAFSPLIHSSTGEFGGNQVIVADDKGGYTFQSVLLPALQGGRESWRQIAW